MRIRSASWLFVFQIAAKLISFPMGIVLARTLGPAGKGSLSVIQLVASTAVVLFNFGLGPAFTYYAARREASGVDVIRLVVGVASLVVVALLGLHLAAGQWFASAVLHTDNLTLVAIGVLTAGPALVGGLVLQFVIGSGSVRNASLVSLASLVFQLTAYVTLALTHTLTVFSAVAVWVTAVVAEAVVLSVFAYKVRAHGVEPGTKALLLRTWRYGLLMWLSGMLGFTALRADMYLLAFFKGTAAVGVYSIAVTFAELVWFLPGALSGVMVPKVAAEGKEGLEPMLRLSRALWPVALVAAIGVGLVAAFVIPVLFGQKFAGAVLPLFLLIPGTVASAAASMSTVYLVGTGRPGFASVGGVLNVGVNIIANLLLIPRLGAAGAALASTASYSTAALFYTVATKRLSGVTFAELLWPRRADLVGLGGAVVRTIKARGAA